MFVLGLPFSAMLLRKAMFVAAAAGTVDVGLYTIAFSFLLAATTALVMWGAWVLNGNEWTPENKQQWVAAMKAGPEERRHNAERRHFGLQAWDNYLFFV